MKQGNSIRRFSSELFDLPYYSYVDLTLLAERDDGSVDYHRDVEKGQFLTMLVIFAVAAIAFIAAFALSA